MIVYIFAQCFVFVFWLYLIDGAVVNTPVFSTEWLNFCHRIIYYLAEPTAYLPGLHEYFAGIQYRQLSKHLFKAVATVTSLS